MKTCLVAFVLWACISTLQASVIFDLGNHPQPDEVNILLNSGQSGTTVTGTSNFFPNLIVNFSSTQSLLAPSSGQARITGNPTGTPLTNMAISLAGGLTYSDLIINPFIGGCSQCIPGGTGTISVLAKDSHGVLEPPAVFTYPIDNGNNFLTISTTNGESIVSTSIVNVGGSFHDLRQPRISGVGVIPEPTTCLLMGMGLVGLGLFRKARR
jgi:hypothetical protein